MLCEIRHGIKAAIFTVDVIVNVVLLWLLHFYSAVLPIQVFFLGDLTLAL